MPDDMYSFKYRNGGFVSCVSSDLVIILFFPSYKTKKNASHW